MSVSAAKSRLIQAQTLMESGRYDEVEQVVDTGMGFLIGLPSEETAIVAAELTALRVAAAEAARAGRFAGTAAAPAWRAIHIAARPENEEQARVLSRACTNLVDCRDDIESGRTEGVAERLTEIAGTLSGFSGEAAASLRAEIDEIRAAAVSTGADKRIDAAGAALATTRLEASVADRWRMTESEFDGWRAESYDGPSRPGEVPDLPKTRLAIMRTGYLLRDPESQQIRTDHAGNPAIQAVYRATDETFEAAAVKLRAAYDLAIDHADGLPAPAVEADVSRLSHLAAAARRSFAHTAHREPVLTRIVAVEARWQAEYTALLRTRQEVYERLTAEADAAWPGIVAATGAVDGFNPADPATVGTTVLLADVHNRSGWDFTGTDFSTRRNGIPVGGSYEPHVLRALEHAWYELKLDVNDRIAWDVVGVVTGPTQLGERTHRALTDQDNREIGTIEEWPLVDAVHLQIIALHAGPVAVGPQPTA